MNNEQKRPKKLKIVILGGGTGLSLLFAGC